MKDSFYNIGQQESIIDFADLSLTDFLFKIGCILLVAALTWLYIFTLLGIRSTIYSLKIMPAITALQKSEYKILLCNQQFYICDGTRNQISATHCFYLKKHTTAANIF